MFEIQYTAVDGILLAALMLSSGCIAGATMLILRNPYRAWERLVQAFQWSTELLVLCATLGTILITFGCVADDEFSTTLGCVVLFLAVCYPIVQRLFQR